MIYFVRGWAFCLLFVNFVSPKRYYITRYGACDDCGKHGYSYNWCNVGSGRMDFDYCSVTAGYTYKDVQCITECDFYGQHYLWCYTDDHGNWDHCSNVEDHSVRYLNSNDQECANYCEIRYVRYWFYKNEFRSQCRTADLTYSDCSTFEGITATGLECLAFQEGQENTEDGDCQKHGESECWCYTKRRWAWNWQFDKCSQFETSEEGSQTDTSIYHPVFPPSEGPFKMISWTVRYLIGGRKLTTFVGYDIMYKTDLRKPTPQQKNDGMRAIYLWAILSTNIWSQPRNLYEYNSILLVLEGFFNRGMATFANLLIQINDLDGQPSTIAQASVEIGIIKGTELYRKNYPNMEDQAYIALFASLRHNKKAWVFKELTDSNGKLLHQ